MVSMTILARPITILNITTGLLSTVFPCRLRHVEGQTVPELQFQAEAFLVALKKLQDLQYGRMMQTYRDDMFELPLPDVPPGTMEILLGTIYSQWIGLHAFTRDNLLVFERPGLLPRTATGEQDVKILVSFASRWTVPFQLNAMFSYVN